MHAHLPAKVGHWLTTNAYLLTLGCCPLRGSGRALGVDTPGARWRCLYSRPTQAIPFSGLGFIKNPRGGASFLARFAFNNHMEIRRPGLFRTSVSALWSPPRNRSGCDA